MRTTTYGHVLQCVLTLPDGSLLASQVQSARGMHVLLSLRVAQGGAASPDLVAVRLRVADEDVGHCQSPSSSSAQALMVSASEMLYG